MLGLMLTMDRKAVACYRAAFRYLVLARQAATPATRIMYLTFASQERQEWRKYRDLVAFLARADSTTESVIEPWDVPDTDAVPF